MRFAIATKLSLHLAIGLLVGSVDSLGQRATATQPPEEITKASKVTTLSSSSQTINGLIPQQTVPVTQHQTTEAQGLQQTPEKTLAVAPLGTSLLDLIPSVAEPNAPIEEPARLVLRLRSRRVHLIKGDREIVSYPVAVGKTGWETPQGQFEVMQKIPDPVWKHPWNGNLVPPGPRNPLGRRWIGFARDGNNLIGFHGTIDESLIGQAVSHGCVRMRNADVEALFEQVEIGMAVTVEP